jgi:hypothetical protein
MEAVARQRILALQELDPAHLSHDNDGASHPAVRTGAAADRIETVAERRLEWHRPARTFVSFTMLAVSPVKVTSGPNHRWDDENASATNVQLGLAEVYTAKHATPDTIARGRCDHVWPTRCIGPRYENRRETCDADNGNHHERHRPQTVAAASKHGISACVKDGGARYPAKYDRRHTILALDFESDAFRSET